MNCPLNQIKETVSEIWDLYSNEFNLTSNEQLGEPENSALASVVSEFEYLICISRIRKESKQYNKVLLEKFGTPHLDLFDTKRNQQLLLNYLFGKKMYFYIFPPVSLVWTVLAKPITQRKM